MQPVIFSIGKFNFYSFGFFLFLSFILSTFIVWLKSKDSLKEEARLDLYLYFAFITLLSARVIYIILHFSSIGFNPLRFFMISETPGLSLLGGMFFGFLFVWIYASRFKLDRLETMDVFGLASLVALFFIKIGELMGGAAFGKITSGPIAVRIAGQEFTRFPVELFEALFFLVGYILLSTLMAQNKKIRQKAGSIFYIFCFLFALNIFLLEFLKEYQIYFYGLSKRQIGALGIILGLIIFFAVKERLIIKLINLPKKYELGGKRKRDNKKEIA